MGYGNATDKPNRTVPEIPVVRSPGQGIRRPKINLVAGNTRKEARIAAGRVLRMGSEQTEEKKRAE